MNTELDITACGILMEYLPDEYFDIINDNITIKLKNLID